MRTRNILLLVSLIALLLGSCISENQTELEVNATPSESVPQADEESAPSTSDDQQPSDLDQEINQITLSLDGYDDDWANIELLMTDPSGDHTPQGADLASASLFLSETSLYGMVRAHDWGLYEFISLSLRDAEGLSHQVYLGVISGVGGISIPGEYNFALPVFGAQEDVIEFKIELSDMEIKPTIIENLTICCDADHAPTDGIAGDQMIPTISLVHENNPVNEDVAERSGHVFLIEENRPADYLYRSFIHAPDRSTLGPDGNIYIADDYGRHIIKLSADGTVEDLGIRRESSRWIRHGPTDVAFDPDGTMYVADNAFIYRVLEDKTLERLKINGWPGAIEFGPDGQFYFIETIDWAIYRWDFNNEPEFITQIDNAYDFAFLHDGRMVVAQIGGTIYDVDLNSGASNLFYEQLFTPDPIYLTVGPDGDVWVRGLNQVDRVDSNGIRVPFSVDGVIIDDWGSGLPDGSDGWSMSGDLVFDENGNLWITSVNARVVRFSPEKGGQGFTRKVINSGFSVTDMISDGQGNLLAFNNNSNELWKISQSGEFEVLFETDIYGDIGLAVDPEGKIYLGRTNGEIIRLEEDGSTTHYAWLGAHRMVFGSDGALYVAASGEYDDHHEIVRVTGVDEYTILKTELDGEQFGGSMFGADRVYIGLSPDEDIFVYDKRSGKLFKLSLNGDEELYYDFSWLGDGRPWIMGVSPTGIPFFTYHTQAHPSSVGYVSEERELVTIAVEASGDPYGIAFSPEGDILYLATFGAISIIPVPAGN